jgi:hypothetical protein
VFKHFANEEGMYVNMLNLHKEDVLVVCSDGYSFLDETKAGIKPEYLEKYNPVDSPRTSDTSAFKRLGNQ